MSELPTGWSKASMHDIANIQLGKMLDAAKNKGVPVPYLRNVNVRWGSFDLSDVFEMRMTKEEQEIYSIHDGDVLICEGGEPGRAAVWCSGQTNIKFQKALHRARTYTGVAPEFVALYMQHAATGGDLESRFTGTTIKHLPLTAIRKVPIPVPPSSEQKRIVAKVESLSAKSRRASEQLDYIPRLVEKYKQAILAAAFRGELTRGWRPGRNISISVEQLEAVRSKVWKAEHEQGRVGGRYKTAESIDWQPTIEVPTGWTWASVDQISFLIQYGSSAKTNEDSTGVAILRMGNIQDGTLDLTSLKFLPEDHDEFPALLLEKGDVIFNRTNSAELVGKTAVYEGEPQKASFASYLIRVRCCGLLPTLLSGYINSAYGRDWVASVVNQQVGQANVNGTKLRRLGIPIMPPEEQAEIVRRVESAFAWVNRLASETTSARKLIDHLDQAILAKAFRGELVPQDPNHEPASALLERIRAERGATAQPPSRSRNKVSRRSANRSRSPK
jgi:type I restriction enzyme S subunit